MRVTSSVFLKWDIENILNALRPVAHHMTGEQALNAVATAIGIDTMGNLYAHEVPNWRDRMRPRMIEGKARQP